MSTHLTQLLAGEKAGSSDLEDSLSHLGANTDAFYNELVSLRVSKGQRLSLFGPYIGRSLLELATTCVLARLDPFRILILRRLQTTASYDVDRRSKAAIQWTGDIYSKDGANAKWDNDVDIAKYSRALLDDYWASIAWDKAAIALLDDLSPGDIGAWFERIRQTDAEGMIKRLRADLIASYSALSKGVHNEFVVMPYVKYDEPTILSLNEDVVRNIATLGLMSHYLDHVSCRKQIVEAKKLYTELQELESVP